MVAMSNSFTAEAAVNSGLLEIGEGALVAGGARFIPTEDDGSSAGTIKIGPNAKIREGAVICSGVTIGRDSIIGHNSVVRRGAILGCKTVLSHMVCVERDARIGSNVRISSLTHITGGCLIEDGVQIGARVVTINDNELRWRASPLLKAPILRSSCRVGSGVTILGHVEIGSCSFIGAGAVVTRSVPPGVLAYGVPAYVQGNVPPDGWLAGASRGA